MLIFAHSVVALLTQQPPVPRLSPLWPKRPADASNNQPRQRLCWMGCAHPLSLHLRLPLNPNQYPPPFRLWLLLWSNSNQTHRSWLLRPHYHHAAPTPTFFFLSHPLIPLPCPTLSSRRTPGLLCQPIILRPWSLRFGMVSFQWVSMNSSPLFPAQAFKFSAAVDDDIKLEVSLGRTIEFNPTQATCPLLSPWFDPQKLQCETTSDSPSLLSSWILPKQCHTY